MDLIRNGNVPAALRRKGAAGELPLSLPERIEILALLTADGDTAIRAKALETLRSWDEAELGQVMANPQTAPDVLRLVAEHLAADRDGLRGILLCNPGLPAEVATQLRGTGSDKRLEAEAGATSDREAGGDSASTPGLLSTPEDQSGAVPPSDDAAVEILAKLAAGAKIEDVTREDVEVPPESMMRDDELTSRDRETLIQKIGRMTVVEKIKAALTGNMETRALLIRDSNKIISRAVLQSPKISETEAEGYAAAKNVSDEVLRLIAANRKFMKSYTVMRALVNNPRAPIDITMPLVIRTNEKDLKGLTLNRNVPEVIRSLAIKMIKQREDAAKVKLHR